MATSNSSSMNLSSIKPIVITCDQWSKSVITFHPDHYYMLIHKKLPGLDKEEAKLKAFASQHGIKYFPIWIPDKHANIFFPFRVDTSGIADGVKERVSSTEVFVITEGVSKKLDIQDKKDFAIYCLTSTAYTIEFTFVPEIFLSTPHKKEMLGLKCVKVTFYCWSKEQIEE